MIKKVRSTRKADGEEEITIETKIKFELIYQTIQRYKRKHMVSYLCNKLMGVSRFSYYNYFDEQLAQNRASQDEAAEVVKDIIFKA